MEFKFDKGAAGEEAPQTQDKGRQTLLLVVLLILLGGFGYLYFFTGLIRPQEKPVAPQPAPQVVKKPLPARDGLPAVDPAAPVAKPAEVPTAQQPVQQAAPAPQPAVKPAPMPAPVAPPVAAKPDVKKPVPAAVKPVEQKAAPASKPEPAKVAAVPQKPVPAKPDAPRPVVAKAAAAKPASKAKSGGPWTLTVGSYVVEETLAADMARVKGAGLTPSITSGVKRATTMHRLFYGEFPDRAAAQQAVEQVRRQSGGAFSVQKGTKHEVFVGSYSMLERAREEQQRLAAVGVKVTIQKAHVGVPARKLTAGTFTDRAVAEIALKKLKKAGIGVPVLE